MLPLRGINKKKMAVDRLNQSLMDDSLEMGRNGLPPQPASVAPEESTDKTDFKAFSGPGDEPRCNTTSPDLLSRDDLSLLHDKENGKNRTAGVEKLRTAVESARSVTVLEEKLAVLVEETCAAISDSHIRVCLAGLELLDPLIRRTGSSLTPHLSLLVETVLAKMGRNKLVLKKNGMKMMVQLMHYTRPWDVVTKITAFGLKHKQSKVREESLNVITAALIRFPHSEFQLTHLAKDIVPLLLDSKPNVRQACMECLAKVSSLCELKEDMQEVMLFAAKNGHNAPNKMSLFNALECRIIRECGPPRLKDDGLVEYAMPVIGIDIPLSQHGPDVDLIRNGTSAGAGGDTAPNDLSASTASRRDTKHRPFRSASKKLPWEMDNAERSRIVKEDDLTNSNLSDTTADLNSTFTLPKRFKTSASLATQLQQRPHSSKQLFAKEGSGSPHSRRPPTGKRQLAPLSSSDVPSPHYSPRGSGTSILPELRDMVPPPPSREGPLPPPIPPPGAKLHRRHHQSLPSRVANRDLPTRSPQQIRGNFASGSPPQLSPITNNSPVTQRDKRLAVAAVDHVASRPPVAPPHGEFSESWPRSKVRGRPSKAAATELITADPLNMVGEAGDSVKTSILRPPSKPRVRQPATMKLQQGEKKLKTSVNQQQVVKGSHQDSPSETEKEFLMCANTTLQDECYYANVPEDTTGLEHSLSSSLTSLCRTAKETTDSPKAAKAGKKVKTEVVSHSRKVQHQSAGCPVSNSPQSTHNDTPDRLGRQHHSAQDPPSKQMEKRTRTGVRIEKDFNRTFTLGESLAHADPSAISWKMLQALTEAAPKPPTPEVSTNKKTRKKKRKSGSNEGSGSSEGSESSFHDNKERNNSQQPREESKEGDHLPSVKGVLRRPAPLGPEGKRPSIERGGKNTVKMEVNGDTSPPPPSPHLSPGKELSPPHVAPSRAGGIRKQRLSEPTFIFDNEQIAAQTETNPRHHRSISFADDDSPERNGEMSEPQPRQSRKKRSKYTIDGRAGRGSKDDNISQANGHHSRHNSIDNDSKNGSPLNRSLTDLQPFSSAERGLRMSLSQLDNSDWNEKCEGLQGIRRLAAHHTDRLVSELHTITLAVVREVENLRSSVSRAAIGCVGDIFVYAGRCMDPELERVVKVLLHKTGESNAFMRESVEKTMSLMIQYANPGKLLPAIIAGGTSNRNAQIRRAAAQFLCQTVGQHGAAQLLRARDLVERTLLAIIGFVNDAAADPRYHGRLCLSYFMDAPHFEETASRTLNPQQWSKLRDAIDMIRAKGVGDPPKESAPSTRSKHHSTSGAPSSSRATSHAKGTGGSRTSVAPARRGGENPPLPERVVERLNANQWEDRLEAINVLEKYVDRHPKALEPHMNKVFDAFNPRLTDRNSKVNLRALDAFSNMIPLLGRLLAPLIANIIKALMPNLASKNSAILKAATSVFHILSECVDPVCLLQPIATQSQHGNARVQPIMINKLAELSRMMYVDNARLVTRLVLPVVWHFMAGKPPGVNEVKEAIIGLCETLYDAMGQILLDQAHTLPPRSQQRLNRVLHSRTFS